MKQDCIKQNAVVASHEVIMVSGLLFSVKNEGNKCT